MTDFPPIIGSGPSGAQRSDNKENRQEVSSSDKRVERASLSALDQMKMSSLNLSLRIKKQVQGKSLVIKSLTNEELTHLAPALFSRVFAPLINQLSPEEFAKLSKAQLMKLTEEQLLEIDPALYNELSIDQLEAIKGQIDGKISHEGLRKEIKKPVEDIIFIKQMSLKSIPTLPASQLSLHQLKAMSLDQFKALTPKQMASIKKEAIEELVFEKKYEAKVKAARVLLDEPLRGNAIKMKFAADDPESGRTILVDKEIVISSHLEPFTQAAEFLVNGVSSSLKSHGSSIHLNESLINSLASLFGESFSIEQMQKLFSLKVLEGAGALALKQQEKEHFKVAGEAKTCFKCDLSPDGKKFIITATQYIPVKKENSEELFGFQKVALKISGDKESLTSKKGLKVENSIEEVIPFLSKEELKSVDLRKLTPDQLKTLTLKQFKSIDPARIGAMKSDQIAEVADEARQYVEYTHLIHSSSQSKVKESFTLENGVEVPVMSQFAVDTTRGYYLVNGEFLKGEGAEVNKLLKQISQGSESAKDPEVLENLQRALHQGIFGSQAIFRNAFSSSPMLSANHPKTFYYKTNINEKFVTLEGISITPQVAFGAKERKPFGFFGARTTLQVPLEDFKKGDLRNASIVERFSPLLKTEEGARQFVDYSLDQLEILFKEGTKVPFDVAGIGFKVSGQNVSSKEESQAQELMSKIGEAIKEASPNQKGVEAIKENLKGIFSAKIIRDRMERVVQEHPALSAVNYSKGEKGLLFDVKILGGKIFIEVTSDIQFRMIDDPEKLFPHNKGRIEIKMELDLDALATGAAKGEYLESFNFTN